MKRFLTLSVSLFALVVLSSCSAVPNATNNPEGAASIASLYNVKTKQTISLDMTREAIEEALGKGEEQPFFAEDESFQPLYEDASQANLGIQLIGYGTGEDAIVITYRDDTPVTISSYGSASKVAPGPSNWCLKEGLTYGSAMADLIETYGETEAFPVAPNGEFAQEGETTLHTPNAIWKNPALLLYAYRPDGLRLEEVQDEMVWYLFSFLVDEEQDGLMWYSVAIGDPAVWQAYTG